MATLSDLIDPGIEPEVSRTDSVCGVRFDELLCFDVLLINFQEELEEAKSQLSERPPSDQLGTLSKQLIDEKNAEIDDLCQQLTLLQSGDRDSDFQQVKPLDFLCFVLFFWHFLISPD